jgi:hypothetical protein
MVSTIIFQRAIGHATKFSIISPQGKDVIHGFAE